MSSMTFSGLVVLRLRLRMLQVDHGGPIDAAMSQANMPQREILNGDVGMPANDSEQMRRFAECDRCVDAHVDRSWVESGQVYAEELEDRELEPEGAIGKALVARAA